MPGTLGPLGNRFEVTAAFLAVVLFVLNCCEVQAGREAGYALLCDGSTSGHVAVTNARALQLTTQATFEAWVFPFTARCNTIVSRGNGGDATTDFIFQVGYNGTTCGAEMRVSFFGAQAWHASSNTIPLQTWTHVAVTYDGAEVKFYINGSLDRTMSRNGALLQGLDQFFYIGRQGSVCSCNYFDGRIDDLRIWNVVRSATQVRDNYLRPLAGNETGLAAYWKFDEAINPLPPLDSTGHGFNGSLVNNARYVSSDAPMAVHAEVTTLTPSQFTAGGATLTALVNPSGWPTTAYFEYGTTTNYGLRTASTNMGAGMTVLTSRQPVSGLLPNGTYHCRVVADNLAGQTLGSDISFTVPGLPPTVVTETASGVTGDSATLNGTINPRGTPTTAYFEYGKTPGYGTRTASTNIGGGTSPVSVSELVSGLESGLTYHFRVVASNSFAVIEGDDLTFNLSAAGPAVITLPAGNIGANRATLRALVSPNGAATQVRFDYGPTPSYGSSIIAANNLQGSNGITVAQVVTGLPAVSQIYWRAAVSNPSGSGAAAGATFRTLSAVTNTPLPTNALKLAVSTIRHARVQSGFNNGQLSFLIDDGGAGYTSPPSVTVLSREGANGGAEVTATVNNGAISGFSVVNHGSYPDGRLNVVLGPPPNPIEMVLTNASSNRFSTLILPAGRFEMNTVITRDVEIQGQGPGLTVLSGGRRGSVLRVQPGVTATFRDLSITQGEAASGGGIYNDAGHVSAYNCDISDNRATGQQGEGGGIYNRGNAGMTLEHCTIRNNTSARSGGGIANSGVQTQLPGVADPRLILEAFINGLSDAAAFGVQMVTDYRGTGPIIDTIEKAIKSAIESVANSVSDINLNPGPLVQEALTKSSDGATHILGNAANQVRNSNISGKINSMPNPFDPGVPSGPGPDTLQPEPHQLDGLGGWASLGAPILVLNDCEVSGNRVDAFTSGMGGAIYNALGLVLITKSVVTGNSVNSTVASFGGAVNSIFGAVSAVDSTFSHNGANSRTALAAGAGINSVAGALHVEGCTFVGNASKALFLSGGGAIQNTLLGKAIVNDSVMIGNSSGGGGAVANDYGAELTMASCTIASNSASGIISAFGGGIYNAAGGTIEITDTLIHANTAEGRSRGGGVYNHAATVVEVLEQGLLDNSSVTLVNCTISSNRVIGSELMIPHPILLANCHIMSYFGGIPCDYDTVQKIPLSLPARGAGIYNGSQDDNTALTELALVELHNCTVVGNSATGKDAFGGGLRNTPSAGFDPRFPGAAKIKVSNTILAYNAPDNCRSEPNLDPFVDVSIVESQGGNLDTDRSLFNQARGGGILVNPDAGLGPLANNGGPTLTHGLRGGSPALNAGNGTQPCPDTDQRGVNRTDGLCDIGAFESVPPVAVADTYEMLAGTPLVVDAANGLLRNDFAAGGSAQLETGGSGAFQLNADGSFTYENSAPGTYVFLYVARDALNQASTPVTVTIKVRPVMKIVSMSPPTNRVDAPRNGAMTITFDTPLDPETVARGLLLHGAQSANASFGFDVQDKMLTVVPNADWHGSEQLTLEILQTLRGTNDASLVRPLTVQFFAGTTSSEGTFARGQELGNTAGRDITLGDLDGDGDLDMYIARRGGDQVWRNLGNGTFALIQTLEEHTSGVALADLDGDGDLDAFVTKNEAGRFPNPAQFNLRSEDGYTLFTQVYAEFNRVLFNDGNGFFSDSGQRMSTGEFFGDERTDYSREGGIVISEPGKTYRLDLSSHWFTYGKIYFPASEGVALADLDGDGDIDAFVINGVTRTTAKAWQTPGNTVWLNNGRGFFTRTEQVLGEDYSEAVALGDLDRDGDIDAFIANRSYIFNAANRLWLNDGHGRFTAGQEIGNANFMGVALGDLDGDGDLDALTPGMEREFDEPWHFGSALWLNDGTGNFVTGQHLGSGADSKVALADFNGDGRLDACFANTATIWFNSGNAQFAPSGVRLGQRFSIAVAAGDLDNDGDADVVMGNDSPFANYYSDEHSAEVWLYRRNPVAQPDSYGVLEDGQLVVNAAAGLLNNDSTPQSTPLTVRTTTIVKHSGTLGQLWSRFAFQDFGYEDGFYVYNQVVPMFAPNGTLNLNADGSFTYTPNKNFFGTDSFPYVISDGVLTATSIVTIVVSPVNDAPLATNDFYALANPLIVNVINGVLANDRDPEGNLMVALLAQPPGHGTLNLNTDGSFTYTPNQGYVGTDAFTYQASDGQTQTLARVKLGNTPPVAVNDAYINYIPATTLTVPIGGGVLSNDSDADGDSGLRATLRVPTANGDLQLHPDGSFTYTPNPGYSGADAFTYEVSDGMTNSAPARAKIGNAQPVALADSYSVVAGFSISGNVLANDSDADGELLTAQLASGPATGQLTLNPNGSFIYAASSNFSGNVTFSYRANDGFTSSVPATVTIAVNARLAVVSVSPPHLATDLPTNTPVTITFSAPVDLASLSGRITVDGSRSYAWNASAVGNTVTLAFSRPFLPGETIRISVKPGIRGTQVELAAGVTWQFQIEAARGGATFVELPVPTLYGTNTFVALGDLDGDGDLDAFAVSGDLTPATLMFNNGVGEFTPQSAGDIGLRRRVVLGDLDRDGDTDALTSGGYTVELWRNNGAGTFTVTTFPAPMFTDFIELADLDADGDLDAFAAGSDLSGDDPRSFVWTWFNDGSGNFAVSQATPTAWTGTDGALGDLNGDGAPDAYLVGLRGDQAWFNDGKGHFTLGTQQLERAFNQAVRLGDLDADGDLDAIVFPGEANRGPRVLINDGIGGFAAPRIQSPPQLTWAIALADVDADGDLDVVEAVVASIFGRDGQNAIWLNNGGGYFTRQTFGFPLGDSQGVAVGDLDGDGDLDVFFANGRVYGETNKIWINRTAPIANDDFYAPNGSSPIVVTAALGALANDVPGDGGSMRAILESNPTRGIVTLNNDGSLTYTPNGSFAGTDVFTYRAADNVSTSAVARVKIGNTAPIAQNDSYTVVQGVTLSIAAAGGVLANDIDAQNDPLKAVLVSGPSHGALQLMANGGFKYAAAANYVGADSFTYYASDGLANSATATVNLNIGAPLTLVQSTPRFNESHASASADIVLQFNRAINPATVSGNVGVHRGARGQAPITTSVSGATVTINPANDFRAGEKVTVNIASGLQDTGGQRLLRPMVFEFTVAAPAGSGSFADTGQRLLVSQTGSNSIDVVLGDLDRDGSVDAFVAQGTILIFNPPTLTPIAGSAADVLWRNSGTGVFSDAGHIGDQNSRGVALGDVDRDGDLDVVTANSGFPEILLNNGSGAFSRTAQSATMPTNMFGIRLGDLDGNGTLDLFVVYRQSFSVWTNDGAAFLRDTGRSVGSDQPFGWVELGDLDNDGDLDAFIAAPGLGQQHRVYFNDGSSVFTDSGQGFNGPNASLSVTLGDIDGDGDLDAYITRQVSDEIWVNDGKGFFTLGQTLPNPGFSRDASFADVDADGDLDAVVLSVNPPVNGSRIWFNDGHGIFSDKGVGVGSGDFRGVTLEVADLDGDGDLDVFLAGAYQHSQVWLNRPGLSAPTGTGNVTTGDKSPVAPFSQVVLRAPAGATISLQVAVDDIAKGNFSPASLLASGFTTLSSNVYALSGRALAQAQAAVRQLVFVPVQNRQPVGFSESTTFTLQASDGTVTHVDAGTTVTVVSANDPPGAINNSFTTTETAAFVTGNVLSNDTDPDPSEALRIVALDLFGTIGTVVNRGDGTFGYDPTGKFNVLPLGATATDSFGYTLDDGHGATASARVTIVISGENSPPVAGNDNITVYEYEGSVVLTPRMLANDSDVDLGDIAGMTVTRVSPPAELLANNVVSYTPDFPNLALGSSTNDSFTYTITDAHGATADATVFITLRGWNDSPLAQNDSATIAENAAETNLTAVLLANDSDADPGETATLTITGTDPQSTKGLVSVTNGIVTYSPNGAFNELPAGATAIDTFDYVIADVHGASSRASMIVTIEGRNNAPLALADAIQVSDGAPATDITEILLANDIDPDTNAATALVVTAITSTATNGIASFDGTRVTYAPRSNLRLSLGQFATDAFTYTIRDAQGATATATATIYILGEDDPPVARPDAFVVDKDAAATNITALLLANDTDPNGGTLIVSSVFTNGMKGVLILSNGIVTYDPAGQFGYLNDGESFSDRFVYTVRDESGNESTTGSIAIVAAGNFPPLITPISDQTVDEETTLTLTVTASDADPAGLRFGLGPNAPAGATIDPITGVFSWTPTEADGPGTNEIVVRVEDAGTPKLTAITSFFVRVNEVNRAPALGGIADASAAVGKILTITNVVIDPDLPANKLTFALGPGTPVTARILKNGTILWKPAKTDARSTNQFTVTVTDNGVPPLSASTSFRVGVGQFLQLNIGSAVLPAGQTGSVPIEVESIVDVTNVQFTLSTAMDRLTNFVLKDFAPGVQGTLISQSDRLVITFTGTLPRNGAIGSLQFDAVGQTSAFVPLKILNLTAPQADSTLSGDGRVTIVTSTPMIEALISATGQRTIAIYGQPGAPYRLESSVSVSGPWSTVSEGTLTNLRQVFDQSYNGTVFFRSVRP